jgi:CheY-like chemotaxis protein
MSIPANATAVRILVADDHAINRQLAKRQLGALGCTVDVVETGREALEAVMRAPYDLIFMDCHMPEMDGWEATEEIRRHEGESRHTPIIALTASAAGSERGRCLEAGMDDFIDKPMSESGLMRVLNRYIFEGARPPIDTSKLDVLRQMNATLVREIIEIYLADTPRQIAAIRDAVAEGNPKLLASAAHLLRSGSANLGASHVLDLCIKLEDLGRAGRMDGAGELVEQLASEYERASHALQKLRQS